MIWVSEAASIRYLERQVGVRLTLVNATNYESVYDLDGMESLGDTGSGSGLRSEVLANKRLIS